MVNRPVVTFHTFLLEFQADYPELCEMYPPGPTVQDICKYYAETSFRSEKVANSLILKGKAKKVQGAGRKLHIVPIEEKVEKKKKQYYVKKGIVLTILQNNVLIHLVKMQDEQDDPDKIVKYNVTRISEIVGCSAGGAAASINKLRRLGYLETLALYNRETHYATLRILKDS